MNSTKSTSRLKIIPGRGLTGRDIQRRLRNRTLEGQIFGDDAYTINEEINEFMKMNTVERINQAREKSKQLKELQNKLDNSIKERDQKLLDQKLENEVKKRMEAISKKQQKEKTDEKV